MFAVDFTFSGMELKKVFACKYVTFLEILSDGFITFGSSFAFLCAWFSPLVLSVY